MKKKKNMETSKRLLLFTCTLCVIISLVTLIAVFVLQDTTPLEYLIVGIFGLCSTSFGFYYWKAKNENIKKYGYNLEADYENTTEFDNQSI